MRRAITPLGSIVRGLVAGAVGAGAQTAFFKATQGLAPKTPEGAFEPPDAEQREEQAIETVARRLAEFARRGPLEGEAKRRASRVVHYSFGALWGVDYALGRESWPALGTPAGALLWSAGVWMTSDNVCLPLARLGAWPHRYPLRVHAYALAAHFAYGAAVAGTYAVLRPGSSNVARGALAGLVAWWRLRKLPGLVRPSLRRSLRAGAQAGHRVAAFDAAREIAVS